jgi:hypothetical protein
LLRNGSSGARLFSWVRESYLQQNQFLRMTTESYFIDFKSSWSFAYGQLAGSAIVPDQFLAQPCRI